MERGPGIALQAMQEKKALSSEDGGVSGVSSSCGARGCTGRQILYHLTIWEAPSDNTNARKEWLDFTAREMIKCYREAFTNALYGNNKEFQN